MEKMTATVLNAKHGAIIMPDADVRVPFGWTNLVGRMLAKIEGLPTEIRACLMVTGIVIDENGLLDVHVFASPPHMLEGGWEQVEDIVADARNEAAWSCVRDHKPGWIVHSPKGFPKPLCPECQEAAGVKMECARA